MAIGRPCSVCTSPDRAAVETDLTSASFAGYAALARSYPHLSEDALARHAANHLRLPDDGPRSLFRGTEKPGLTPEDIAHRRRALADTAKAAREALEAAGRHLDAGKASAIEERILASMEARTGARAAGDELADRILAEASVLAAAVGHVARENPLFGRSVAAELRSRGAEELAAELERTSRKAIA